MNHDNSNPHVRKDLTKETLAEAWAFSGYGAWFKTVWEAQYEEALNFLNTPH